MVGVVVSKLDALKIAARVGNLPQNANFAISGEVMCLLFIDNDRVNFAVSRNTTMLGNAGIASEGEAVDY